MMRTCPLSCLCQPEERQVKMAKVSSRKKNDNANSKQKLSDIVPDLAHYNTAKKEVRHCVFLFKAMITARYAAEKKLSKDVKSKIKNLFEAEHTFANFSISDFLLGLSNLQQDERKYWCRELTGFYQKVKETLFEALDSSISNQNKFNNLLQEELRINQGLSFESDSYQGFGVIDKKTRIVKFPKPANDNPGGGQDGGEAQEIPYIPLTPQQTKAINYLYDVQPESKSQEWLASKIETSQSYISREVQPTFMENGLICTPKGKTRKIAISAKGIEFCKKYLNA